MAKRGPKNKYHTHVEPRLDEIRIWCRAGLIEKEICKRLGIYLSTFQRYKNQYKELKDTVRKGKEFADFEVEDALFKRAKGFDYEEVETTAMEENIDEKKQKEKNGKKNTKVKRIRRTKKLIIGDVGAQKFWLTNRRPDKWKNQHILELPEDGVVNINVNIKDEKETD